MNVVIAAVHDYNGIWCMVEAVKTELAMCGCSDNKLSNIVPTSGLEGSG